MHSQIVRHSDDGFIVAAFDGKIWIAVATTPSPSIAEQIAKVLQNAIS